MQFPKLTLERHNANLPPFVAKEKMSYYQTGSNPMKYKSKIEYYEKDPFDVTDSENEDCEQIIDVEYDDDYECGINNNFDDNDKADAFAIDNNEQVVNIEEQSSIDYSSDEDNDENVNNNTCNSPSLSPSNSPAFNTNATKTISTINTTSTDKNNKNNIKQNIAASTSPKLTNSVEYSLSLQKSTVQELNQQTSDVSTSSSNDITVNLSIPCSYFDPIAYESNDDNDTDENFFKEFNIENDLDVNNQRMPSLSYQLPIDGILSNGHANDFEISEIESESESEINSFNCEDTKDLL